MGSLLNNERMVSYGNRTGTCLKGKVGGPRLESQPHQNSYALRGCFRPPR